MTAREKTLRLWMAQMHDALMRQNPEDPWTAGALSSLKRVMDWMEGPITVRAPKPRAKKKGGKEAAAPVRCEPAAVRRRPARKGAASAEFAHAKKGGKR